MKKIKNMKQLREERRRLQRREKELEWQINKSWQHLKESIRPEEFFKERIRKEESFRRPGPNGESILQSTLSFGAGLLARTLARKAEEKLGRFFNR
jgi:hypothetical protein